MNLNQSFVIKQVIEQILKNSKKVKFNSYLIKNIDIIEKELEVSKKSLVFSNEFNEYETKRIDLCKTYCEKDQDGNPLIKAGQFSGLIGNEEFEESFNELKNQKEECIEEHDKQLKEFNEMVNEEKEIAFIKIPLDIVPDDVMGGEQQKIISPLLEDV